MKQEKTLVKQYEILEGNRLIDEFMGFIIKDFDGAGIRRIENELQESPYYDWLPVKHLEYDSSWEALMPVVNNICKNYYDSQPQFEDDIITDNNIFRLSIMANIKDVWLSAVEFIRWHNNQIQ